MIKRGIVAASFDPVTLGHESLIVSSSKLLDELYVSIGFNPDKKSLFSVDEKREMIEKVCEYNRLTNVTITEYPGKLLIDYALEVDANYIVRGIRNSTDLEYEVSIKRLCERVSNYVEILYLVSPLELSHVSSRLVKSLLSCSNWERVAAQYVNPFVLKKMKEKACQN